MRTMFIPHLLIIFCSLLVIVEPVAKSVGGPTAKPVEEIDDESDSQCKPTEEQRAKQTKHIHPGCSSIYKCFAPAFCEPGGENTLTKLNPATEITDDCPVIFRYHAYAKHMVHISIESLKENVTQIEIDHSKSIKMSCTKNDAGTAEARFQGKIYTLIEDDKPDPRIKFRCTFKVELSKGESVFLVDEKSILKWMKDGKRCETDPDSDTVIFAKSNLNCDPGDIKFNQDVTDSNKKYTPVKYKPGEYYCDNPSISKMEYREKDFEKYAESRNKDENLKCVNKKFVVVKNKNKKELQYPVDVRCAAPVRFFCEDDVFLKVNEEKLNRTLPNIAAKIPSALSCPAGKPHLIANKKLYRDARIECVNDNGTPRWNVSSADKHTIISSSSPEVYCTDTLKCSDFWKIPSSSVIKGTLNHENLPMCYAEGSLEIGGKNVTNPRCDITTGYYKYTIEGVEKIVEKDTKFECTYPLITDELKDTENQNVLMRTLYISIGVSSILGIVIIVGGIAYSNHRIKQRKKIALEKLATDELAWNQYVLNEDEREDLKYAKKMERMKQKNGSEDSEKEQSLPIMNLSKWNDMQMNAFSVATRMIFKDATTTTPPVHLKHMDMLPKPDDESVKAPGFVNEKAQPASDTITKQRMRASFADRLAKQFR